MAGWFDFVNGQTLPASRVQDYLMDQSVMVFASAAARTTALPTPTDGMVSYLTDSDRLFVWRSMSSAWVEVVDSTNLAAQSAVLPTRRNVIINGGFDIWQRGTSGSNGGPVSYTADRWSSITYAGGSMNWSRQNPSTTLFNSQYCARIQRPAGSTNTATMNLGYSLETADSLPLRNKSITLSFWARAGANFSPTSSVLNYSIITGTGTDQNVWGFSGATTSGYTATLTTTWQKFTATMGLGSALTQLGFNFYSQVTGTAGANDYYEIAEVQLEVSSVATPFVRAGGTLQGELAACQRYFQVFTGNAVQENVGAGQCYATTNALIHMSFMTTLRAAPTVSFSAATDFRIYSANGTEVTLSSIIGAVAPTINTCRIVVSVPSVLVAGNATAMIAGNTNARINVSAEL